jgi:hypothetical protein
MLLPLQEDSKNPISSGFTNSSKHPTFENRTEPAESRALERIEHPEKDGRALPIGSPELKSEIAANTGLDY